MHGACSLKCTDTCKHRVGLNLCWAFRLNACSPLLLLANTPPLAGDILTCLLKHGPVRKPGLRHVSMLQASQTGNPSMLICFQLDDAVIAFAWQISGRVWLTAKWSSKPSHIIRALVLAILPAQLASCTAWHQLHAWGCL